MPLSSFRVPGSAVPALLCCALAGLCKPVRTSPPAPIACAGPCTDTLSVQFLGVAGWLVRYGDDAVLTAPLFTMPKFGTVTLAGDMRSLPADVDSGMRPVDVRGVSAILVGHAHYDHLLDVPRVAERWATRAAVYGNRSMVNQLAADPALRGRLVPVEDWAATGEGGGRWIYPKTDTLFRGPRPVTAQDSSVRILPVLAEHPPHVAKVIHMYAGEAEMRTRAPRTSYDWREGQVHAFVIEFLDVKRHAVLFRVHFSDAPSWQGVGIPPLWVGPAGSYDLALTSVGSYDQVRGQKPPVEFIQAVHPRHLVAGHYENFFGHDREPRTQPAAKVQPYLDRVKCAYMDTTSFTLPHPGDTIRICSCTPRPAGEPVPASR